MLLISPSKAQVKIANSIRERRLQMDLTQEGLADRSGVPLATLRKFEQKGIISLESLLKLLMIVGGLDEIVNTLKPRKASYETIDDVLKDNNQFERKRGRKK
ncbi:helix-turn-helix transcriptional regulator [Belliella kenyensis]|uniref:Helix-turn-helix transcriptional regulator n=1 Tax=Belliella kenyensis TaxID=1472724 RepID=A0ABV8ENF6_9BACT|nr:helix-turn-helix transcriptional regulator [Belliella kenyensis]MCH7402024.1 helix-turn-helix domain-containing protein [Belliella kenyensis]MDN3605188.1 helix-turn-helix transcriptional regulator [Belliella kenyensis]